MNNPLLSLGASLSGRTLLALTEALEHSFDASAWVNLGLELDMPQLGHPESRLQASLRLGDDDYGYCVAQFVRHLEGERPGALRDIAQRSKVREWLESNAPGAVQELAAGQARASPTVTSLGPGEILDRALQAAQNAAHGIDPLNGATQVHAALHSYLRALCARANLEVADDASVAQLVASVRNGHPKIVVLDQHDPRIGDVLAGLADSITALGTVDKNESRAHPNPVMLEEAEAMLMVGLVQTLFNYLQARL